MSVSSDDSIGVVWNNKTTCLFFDLSTLKAIGSYVPPNPSGGSTGKITFSKDNHYAIVETDNYNPLVILELSNFTVWQSLLIDDVIHQSYFLGTDNQRVIVFGKTATLYVELLAA